MRLARIATIGVALVLGSCASEETTKKARPKRVAAASPAPRPSPDAASVGAADAGSEPDAAPSDVKKAKKTKKDDGVAVTLQIGYLKQEQAEVPIEGRWDELAACYERAGKARRYADGTVKLRFLIAATGGVSDVLVIDSELGNLDVERCLIEVGRTVQFHAPEGRKPTSFDYPIQFKSTRQMVVIEWPRSKVDPGLENLLLQIDDCDPLGPREVAATMYIGRGGVITSAGFAAPAAVDPFAAECALKIIRGWRLPPTPDMKREIRKLVVARTTFTIKQQAPGSSGRKKRPLPKKRTRS